MKRFIKSVDVIATDLAFAAKVFCGGVFFLASAVVVFSIGTLLGYAALGQTSLGMEFFLRFMNLEGVSALPHLKPTLVSINWVVLASMVLGCLYLALQYLQTVRDRADFVIKASNIAIFPGNKNRDDNGSYQSAANS